MNRCLFVNVISQKSCQRLRLQTKIKAGVATNIRHCSNQVSFAHASNKITAAIANSDIVNWTKTNLIELHQWSGLPWWATFFVVTLTLRSCVTFPLGIFQERNLLKYEALKPEINHIAKHLSQEVKQIAYGYNWPPAKAKLYFNKQLKREVRKLIERDNCHPFRSSLIIWFQFPVWIILSFAMRNMIFRYPSSDSKAQAIHDQLQTEGLLWISNLTVADPYYVVPVLLGIVNLANVEVHRLRRLKSIKEKTKFFTFLTNFGRCWSILFIPIASIMPSGLSFYWLTSASFALIQNLIINSYFTNNNKVK